MTGKMRSAIIKRNFNIKHMYEFVKIKHGNKCRWYFHPMDITDVYVFVENVFMAEYKDAIAERDAYTFTNKNTSEKVVCYHPTTSMGCATQAKSIFPINDKTWYDNLREITSTAINDIFKYVQQENKDVYLTQGTSYFVAPDSTGYKIVERIERSDFIFPGGRKYRPSDITYETVGSSDVDEWRVYLAYTYVGTYEAKYMAYRAALKAANERNAKQAMSQGLAAL